MVQNILPMDLEKYSDEDIKKLLNEYGMESGPITQTTRNVYIKKLKKLVLNNPKILNNTISNVTKGAINSNYNKSVDKTPKRLSKEHMRKSINSLHREKELPHNILNSKDETSNPFPLSRTKHIDKSPKSKEMNIGNEKINSYEYSFMSKNINNEESIIKRSPIKSTTFYSTPVNESLPKNYSFSKRDDYPHYTSPSYSHKNLSSSSLHENLHFKYFTNLFTKPSFIQKILTIILLIGSLLILYNLIKYGSNIIDKDLIKVPENKKVCNAHDKICKNEQDHIFTLKIARIMYDLLSKRAGQYECNWFQQVPKNYTTQELLLKLKSKYPSMSQFQLNEHMLSAINLIMSNPHWGIELADKSGNIYSIQSSYHQEDHMLNQTKELKVQSPHQINWLSSTKPYLPFWCKTVKTLCYLLHRLFSIAMAFAVLSLLGYGSFNWVKHKKRQNDLVFQMIQEVLDIIRQNYENFQTSPSNQQADGEIYPYIAIAHVRDMIIPPNKRLEMKMVWDKVVDYVSLNESRIRLETQMIHGEPFEVWRWLPSSGFKSTTNPSTKKYTSLYPNLVDSNKKKSTLHNFHPNSTVIDEEESDDNEMHFSPNFSKSSSPSNTRYSNISKWQGPAFEIQNQSVIDGLTPCLKIRNMHDKDFEGKSDWPERLKDAILEKCGPEVYIVHMVVDHTSPDGCIFVKCASNNDAGAAYKALHGWWYAGNLIAVKYLRLQRYLERFPDAVHSNAPLSPQTK